MYKLFIDEAGDTSENASNDPRMRFLSVTGVAFKEEYYRDTFVPDFDSVRANHFDHSDNRRVVLQRQQMARRQNAFVVLRDSDKLEAWLQEQDRLLSGHNYFVISSCIDKIAFYYEHPNWQDDPYKFCVLNLIERFCLFLHYRNEQGSIVAESRWPAGKPKSKKKIVSDELVTQAYKAFLSQGSRFIPPHRIQNVLPATSLDFKTKNDDVPGLQLADLACKLSLSAARRIYTGHDEFIPWNYRIFRCLWHKYLRDSNNKPEGRGLIWRPQRNPVEQ